MSLTLQFIIWTRCELCVITCIISLFSIVISSCISLGIGLNVFRRQIINKLVILISTSTRIFTWDNIFYSLLKLWISLCKSHSIFRGKVLLSFRIGIWLHGFDSVSGIIVLIEFDELFGGEYRIMMSVVNINLWEELLRLPFNNWWSIWLYNITN